LGVFFEFRDFKHWAEETQEYRNVPSTILESLKYLVMGLVCLGISVIGSIFFPVSNNWNDEFIANSSYVYRVLYPMFSCGLKRYFYYTAFLFQTGTVIACGLGYNGKDPKSGADLWDKFMGVYLFDAETASNANEFLKAWNYRVHVWLKYYVSERLTGVGQKAKSWHYLAVYCTSAFWHGFYPFYYVAFTVGALGSFAHKDIYGSWYLFSGIPRSLRVAVCIAINQYTVNYALVLQAALTFENGGKFLTSTCFILPAKLVLILCLTRGAGLLSMSKRLERKDKAKSAENAIASKVQDENKMEGVKKTQ
jgi:lysophospholipid acyltransferase